MKQLSLLFLIVLLYSFESAGEYELVEIVVTGNLFSFSGNDPIKHRVVFFDANPFDDGNPEKWADSDKTNSRGKFIANTWVYKSNPTLYLYAEGYAKMSFINCPVNAPGETDTIHLGDIYLVQYDNELIEERYNMPEKDKPVNDNFMSISEIDSMLQSNPEKYNMYMNIVTTNEQITRYNFGPEKPRGTTIKSFKTIDFVRDMSTQN